MTGAAPSDRIPDYPLAASSAIPPPGTLTGSGTIRDQASAAPPGPRGGSVVDLTSLTDEQFRLWLDGYSNGYMNGLEVGGDIRDAEWDARLLRAAKIVHAAASWPSHARRPRSKSGLEDGGPVPSSPSWPLEIEVQEEVEG